MSRENRIGITFLVLLIFGLSTLIAGCPGKSDEDVKKDAAAAADAGTEAFEAGDFDQAIDKLEEAAETDPEDALIQRKLAQGYEAKGRLDEALATYNKSIELDPEQTEVIYRAAIIKKSQGDTDAAIEGLKNALDVDEDFVPARIILGDLYVQKGENEQAKTEYQTVIDLEPFGIDIEAIQAKLDAID